MKKKVWCVTIFVSANNKIQAYNAAADALKEGHFDVAEPFLSLADDVLNIAAKLKMGVTYGEVTTEITQYLVDKKHINIKYALPVAERIVQMVEKAYEECDD